MLISFVNKKSPKNTKSPKGHGRIRISVLFRSVETKLPPSMLGWDVGTFEFTSDRILALNYNSRAKLKMRTGGSTGAIPRTQAQPLPEGDGMFWDIAKKDGKHNVKLPVKYRYRSPVVFEFHVSGKKAAAAYAVIWLHHLTDNQEVDINIPIWTTKKGDRLTQNYVTEQNLKEVPGLTDVEEIGRLQFRCRFKAGTDESHEKFITDNDSRETQETWEACKAEGVRHRKVNKEMPKATKELHEKSLTEGRDVLKQADPEEKKKWLSKDGTDWSGAFGEDPAQYVDPNGSRKNTEEGEKSTPHDPQNPSDDDVEVNDYGREDDGDSDSDSSESDLGIKDGDTHPNGEANGTTETGNKLSHPVSQYKEYKENEKGTHRRQRGLMQWKPMRNAQFAKDEAKFAVRRMKNKMALKGREPDVETEA